MWGWWWYAWAAHAAVVAVLCAVSVGAFLLQVVVASRARAWDSATKRAMAREARRQGMPLLKRAVSLPPALEQEHATTTKARAVVTKSELEAWRACLHEQGAEGWTWGGVDQVLQHTPWYLWALYRLVMVRLPVMALGGIVNRLTKGSWVPDQVSDDHVFDMVISTPLIIVAKHDTQANTLTLRVPADLPAEFFNGSSPRGLVLVLDCASHQVLQAEQPAGVPISPSPQQAARGVTRNQIIMGHLLGCNYCWLHPRTHVLAEKSAREIVDKRIAALEPSSRFVASLHDGLVFGSLSPIRCPDESPASCLGSIKALFACIDSGPLPHDLAQSKRALSPYFDFLLFAHEQVRFWVKFYELEVSSEALFSNMVAHAVDHTELHRVLGRSHWLSIDTSGSWRSYLCSQMFREIWVPHISNPFDLETLRAHAKTSKVHPFYRNLYWSLRAKSVRFADMVTMSSSW